MEPPVILEQPLNRTAQLSLEGASVHRSSRPKKNMYKFYMGNNVHREVVISSNFDSGNIELIRQVNEFFYRLAAVSDTGAQVSRKTWFYFKVRAYRNCRLKLVVENVDVLSPAYEVIIALMQWQIEGCKPVCRVGEEGQWHLCNCYIARRQELELHIEHTFQSDESVFFALSVPFSYEEHHNFLKSVEETAESVPEFYFKKELLTYSLEQRMVHLLTITQKEPAFAANQTKEQKFDPKLFPQNNRALRFDKPVILIASRVHPGEVASSHSLAGMIKFLLNPKDLRAYILRRLFVFMIVPMLNPDGVWEGNYRMDLLNRNLNRLYTNPDFATEYNSILCRPQVYGLRKLADYLASESRMYLYLDMHGHSSTKPAFVYGNALQDIVNQVENQLFCRLLSQNTRFFSYEQCNFTEEQMTTKDRDEMLTKEGCSRVCFGRLHGVMLSLTLQIGLHPVGRNCEMSSAINTQFAYENFTYTDRGRATTITQIWEEIGEETMITLLDSIDKNPYSRLPNTSFKTLDGARRAVASQMLQDDQRFRRTDVRAYQKVKTIDKMSQEYFGERLLSKWSYLLADQKFCKFDWPTPGLKLLANLKPAPAKLTQREKSPKKKVRPDLMKPQQALLEDISILKDLRIAAMLTNPATLNSKTLLNPTSIDLGGGDSEQVTSRSRHPNNIAEDGELRKSTRLKLRDANERPLLMVREIQLPKLIKNMTNSQSQDDRLGDKRKHISHSPAKRQRREMLTEGSALLIGTERESIVPTTERQSHRQSRSKRKLSILESLRKVEEEAEELFGNMNTRVLDPYNAGLSFKRSEHRIKTENTSEDVVRSNKETRRQLLTTEPNIIDQILQRENERYDRLRHANQNVEEQRSRNVRDSKRELLNVKLRQFRRKGQHSQSDQSRKPVLPSLKKDESENEQFDDLAVRDHSRELKEQEAVSERQVKLYISSRRVVSNKPGP